MVYFLEGTTYVDVVGSFAEIEFEVLGLVADLVILACSCLTGQYSIGVLVLLPREEGGISLYMIISVVEIGVDADGGIEGEVVAIF